MTIRFDDAITSVIMSAQKCSQIGSQLIIHCATQKKFKKGKSYFWLFSVCWAQICGPFVPITLQFFVVVVLIFLGIHLFAVLRVV